MYVCMFVYAHIFRSNLLCFWNMKLYCVDFVHYQLFVRMLLTIILLYV